MTSGTPSARAAGAAVLALGLMAGCQTSARRAPYADNPLLISRQPAQVHAGAPTSDQVAHIAEVGPRTVVPPPLSATVPPTATASLTRTGDAKIAADGPGLPPPPPLAFAPPPTPTPVAAALVPPELPIPQPLPIAALPTAPPPPAPAAPETSAANNSVALASARKSARKYDRAPDYSWLQGELDRHYRGHLDLRYCPTSEEDAHGGKVRLDSDPRLAEFRPGDIVLIEGELIRDPDASASAPWGGHPRYHIRAIRLLERP